MKYCDICKQEHFDIDVYREWLMEYGRDGKTFKTGRKNSRQKQIDRWREIVERHGTRRE